MDVAIVGVGQSSFGRKRGLSIQELCFEAFKEAMEDARNLSPQDIDASIICSSPEYDKQRSPAGAVAEYLGLNPETDFSSGMRLLCEFSGSQDGVFPNKIRHP